MKIALAQMKMALSIQENLEKSLQLIETAAQNQADLIFFPELQLYPFFPQYEKLNCEQYLLSVEEAPIQQIIKKAKEKQIIVSPNIYLSNHQFHYDASLFINAAGEIQGISKMVHIVQGQNFYEQDYYSPADDGFKVYDTPFGKIGIVICFDRHLPESIRTCAAKGADLILIPTANVKGEPLDMFEWELRIQAMHSSVFIAMCNRVGTEGKMEFIGQSIVIDPHGNILCKANNEENLLFAEVDLKKGTLLRNQNPYFTLRRPEMYR